MAQQPTPAGSPGTMTIQDALQRVDNILTRVPMKMQEEHEQLMEARQLLMNVIQTYEGIVKEKTVSMSDLQKYTSGLEAILEKVDTVSLGITMPERPNDLMPKKIN